jgi:hypothetical protein
MISAWIASVDVKSSAAHGLATMRIPTSPESSQASTVRWMLPPESVRKIHPRTRHHLAFERVTMDVHDTRKDNKVFSIDCCRGGAV